MTINYIDSAPRKVRFFEAAPAADTMTEAQVDSCRRNLQDPTDRHLQLGLSGCRRPHQQTVRIGQATELECEPRCALGSDARLARGTANSTSAAP